MAALNGWVTKETPLGLFMITDKIPFSTEYTTTKHHLWLITKEPYSVVLKLRMPLATSRLIEIYDILCGRLSGDIQLDNGNYLKIIRRKQIVKA